MLVYLGSPYSHKDINIMYRRYYAACRAAAKLMTHDLAIFAPISHSHPISEFMSPDKRTDFDFWMAQDIPVLRRCDQLWVLKLDGWMDSRGLTKEIMIATECKLPIKYVDPSDIGIKNVNLKEAA
jgi:hypothetical protein